MAVISVSQKFLHGFQLSVELNLLSFCMYIYILIIQGDLIIKMQDQNFHHIVQH